MTTPGYRPSAGDLIWTDLDPTLGREQAGRRAALVISSAAFTEHTGLAVVCPITSRVRPFPTSHVRSIDTNARPVVYAGRAVPRGVAELVRAKIATFITI